MTIVTCQSEFYESLNQKIKNDTLILPTLPAIAFKVRDACDDPDVDAAQITRVISLDIALSARIIRVANSAHLNRGVKVKGVKEAVTRIGLRSIKNIATALAMEQLFVSNHESIQRRLASIWRDTITVASNSVAALSIAPPALKRRFNNDALMLAALIYNIGSLPIIREFEEWQEICSDPSFLNKAIDALSSRVGVSVLESWDFDDQFVDVAKYHQSLKYNPDEINYVDWVRLGVAVSGFNKKNKDAVISLSISKGMIDNASLLHSKSFIQARESITTIFKDD